MSRTQWLVTGGALLLVGLAVGSFFLTYKQEKQEVRVPPSGEARKNPYLALERLYTRMGLETGTSNTATKPNRERALVFVTDRVRNFTPEQIEKWTSWVESGGHLVLPAPPNDTNHAPVVEAFGAEATEPPEANPDSGPNTSNDKSSEPKHTEGSHPEDPEPEPSTDATSEGTSASDPEENFDRTFAVDGDLDPLARWSLPAVNWRAGSADGELAAMSRPVSAGRLTVVADAMVFQNSRLDENEHAPLAWAVARLDENAERQQTGAEIVLFSAQKSWLRYVAAHTWPLLVGLGLILLFSLNAARWRFGPLLPDPPPERRSRVEHIRATGEFIWEHDAAADMSAAARESLIEELSHRRPSLKDATGDKKRAIVAEMLDLDVSEAELMFDDRDRLSKNQFQKRIELIESYRREL